jgi:hypothetical protein
MSTMSGIGSRNQHTGDLDRVVTDSKWMIMVNAVPTKAGTPSSTDFAVEVEWSDVSARRFGGAASIAGSATVRSREALATMSRDRALGLRITDTDQV